MTTNEAWRPVAGHPYEVSNLGRVRRTKDAPTYNGGLAARAGHILKGGTHSHGYRVVGGSGLYVHRLVATAFVPNPNARPNVNHIDGDPANNCAENLEWVNQSENVIHARDVLGRSSRPHNPERGIDRHCAKLDDAKVVEIRRLRRSGLTLKVIGARFGVTDQTVLRVVSGRNWKHVTEQLEVMDA